MVGMQKYIGRPVEIVYMDRSGKCTKRVIVPYEVGPGWVKAYCRTRKAPRLFFADRILAALPAAGTG